MPDQLILVWRLNRLTSPCSPVPMTPAGGARSESQYESCPPGTSTRLHQQKPLQSCLFNKQWHDKLMQNAANKCCSMASAAAQGRMMYNKWRQQTKINDSSSSPVICDSSIYVGENQQHYLQGQRSKAALHMTAWHRPHLPETLSAHSELHS